MKYLILQEMVEITKDGKCATKIIADGIYANVYGLNEISQKVMHQHINGILICNCATRGSE